MQAPPLPGSYKDRQTSLRVFGVITAVIGGLCFLLMAFIFLSTLLPRQPGMNNSASMIIMSGAVYAVLGTILIWLGVGSFLCRRWARALLVICSWLALASGIIATLFMVLMFPQLLATMEQSMAQTGQKVPPAVLHTILIVQGLFMLLIYIVLPVTWAIFYTHRNTRLTCEARDPVTRWTDRCPLPVLALSMCLAGGAIFSPFMIAYHGVLPFFGTFLNGVPGSIAWLILGAVYAFLAWSAYRLKSYTWWAALLLILLFSVSSMITISRLGILPMYEQMGFSAEMLQQMRPMYAALTPMMTWGMLLWLVPAAAYLIWLRRYFVAPKAV